VRIAEVNLERILEWVSRFDNKSLIVLGVDTALLGILSGSAPQMSRWVQATQIFAGIAFAILAASFILVYTSTYPRTKTRAKSLLFFGTVSELELDDFRHASIRRTEREYLDDLLEQCHKNSEIVASKFKSLTWAYRFLLLSLPFWAITLYLFKSLPPGA